LIRGSKDCLVDKGRVTLKLLQELGRLEPVNANGAIKGGAEKVAVVL